MIGKVIGLTMTDDRLVIHVQIEMAVMMWRDIHLFADDVYPEGTTPKLGDELSIQFILVADTQTMQMVDRVMEKTEASNG